MKTTYEMNEGERKIAEHIGKQMDGKIYCPDCLLDTGPIDPKQDLRTYGDYPDRLFCPHCELTVEIIVKQY